MSGLLHSPPPLHYPRTWQSHSECLIKILAAEEGIGFSGTVFSGVAEGNQAASRDQSSLSPQSPALSAGPDEEEGAGGGGVVQRGVKVMTGIKVVGGNVPKGPKPTLTFQQGISSVPPTIPHSNLTLHNR